MEAVSGLVEHPAGGPIDDAALICLHRGGPAGNFAARGARIGRRQQGFIEAEKPAKACSVPLFLPPGPSSQTSV